jgi:NADH dehydrogenase
VRTLRAFVDFVLRETGRRRFVVPLPWGLARAQGSLMGALDRFSLGLMPQDFVITRDQVALLQRDNVVSEPAVQEGRTLQGIGIEPTALEAIVPAALVMYRKTGQFDLERKTAPPTSGGSGPPVGQGAVR